MNWLLVAHSTGKPHVEAAQNSISIGLLLFYLAFFVFMLWASIQLFQKAKREWWEAIVPIYNIYVVLRIVGRPGWWLLLLLIPFVNILVAISVAFDLSRSFGGSVGTAVGLGVLPFIFVPYMAFSDKYKYKGPAAAK